MKHGLAFSDVNGDGWCCECFCGKKFWREFEWQALNAYQKHEDSAVLKTGR